MKDLRTWVVGGIVLCSVMALTVRAEAATRPNIVYFYADDLGWGSIGANGQTQIQTPKIDSIATSGVNFIRGYGCPVCSPARSSQQTGFHQGHTWTDRNDPAASKAMRQEDPTMGDVLATAGYRTGYYGKWGYGADQTLVNPQINNPQTLPINHGYDEILAELHHVRAHTFFQPTLWRSNTSDPVPTTALVTNQLPSDPSYPTHPAHQDDPTYPAPAYCDDSYAFAALDFIRSQAQTPEPFFCLLAFQIPHTPLGDIATLPQWFEAYSEIPNASTWPAAAQQFAAMVTRMDAHIGNILAALEDPNQDGDSADSVLEDTLIIFSSDNGGQGGTPETFFDGNGIFRGSKGTVYEGGIRVPTLMQWKGTLPADTISTQIVDVTDMLPTFAELAGVPSPVGTDGVSLAPTLTGQGIQRSRDFLIHEDGSNWSIIRGPYKLTKQSGALALYDLEADPGESTNLASSQPALRDELEALALGERVEEPNSFANTHHAWTGPDQGATSNPDHWSDTQAPNPVVDTGAPRSSWNAIMAATGPTSATAIADADIDTLGFEIAGLAGNAIQYLDLGAYTLTGRNEIRVSSHGAILLNGGTLSSLRWIDLQSGGLLSGAGAIEADLLHAGLLTVTESSETTIPGPDIVVPGPDIVISNGANIVTNGGFELGGDTGGGDYSFATLENWFTEPGLNDSLDAAKPNNSNGGMMRALMQASGSIRYPLIQNTGVPIALGETFDLTFWHRGFSGWDSGDQIQVRVFYEDAVSNRVDLFSATVAPDSLWNEATYSLPAVTDTGAVGRILHVLFIPDTLSEAGAEYVSIDDVTLVRHGDDITAPGPDITIPGPDITLPGTRRLEITGGYRGFAESTLALTLAAADTPGDVHTQLVVVGRAVLGGGLELSLESGFTPADGDRFTLLSAASITGRFAHADDMVSTGPHHFRIHYTSTHVTAEKIPVAARGTPHWWLIDQGMAGPDFDAEELRDDDTDGMMAWEEFQAGTNPSQSTSNFALDLRQTLSSPALSLHWTSASNRLYYLEARDQSGDEFSPAAGPFAADPPENVLSNIPATSSARNYRMEVRRR